MILLPAQLLLTALLGFISFLLLCFGLILLFRGGRALRRRTLVLRQAPSGKTVAVSAVPAAAGPLASSILVALIAGALLVLWTFSGKYIVLGTRPAGDEGPQPLHGAVQELVRPDGSRLHMESFGPAGAPTIVLTHGWSLDSDEWYYVKRDLGSKYRLIVWDLPGLGQSKRPDNRDYALDTMADDLGAVIDASGASRVVLVGHSIGGMINLTFCRRFPDRLGRQVAGIVEVNTTYTDPVKTTKNASTATALQKPVYEPLLYATIALSPLVRALNWLAYQNGLAHLQATSSFAGTETRGQLDFAARYLYKSSPAVVARGMLGMLHWDATDVLPGVRVPVLLLAGDQDTATLPQASEQMRNRLPAAELQVIRPAAHLGLLEQNRQYDDLIQRFAETCFRGKS